MVLETENRGKLYYSKYKYRARFRLEGLNRTFFAQTIDEYNRRMGLRPVFDSRHPDGYPPIDLAAIARYLLWKNEYTAKTNKQALVRVEHNTASVFSNDLALLQTLADIDPGVLDIHYSQVDVSIPEGVKYFVDQPKHQFRTHVSAGNATQFYSMAEEFINRYTDSNMVMVPSRALVRAVRYHGPRYSQASAYFFDYDVESAIMVIKLVFGNQTGQTFRLMKKP